MEQSRRLDPPFAVATAVRSGVSRFALRGASLEAPFHGVRVGAGMAEGLEERCRALSVKLPPGHAFGGPTAARLWGLPLPRAAEGDPCLFVCAPPGARALRRVGVIGSVRSGGARIVRRDGLPVLAPVDAWCSLAVLLGIDDLIAVGDALVAARRHRPALCTLDELRTAPARRRGARGVRRLERALEEVRVGSWSRAESFARLALTRAGLPEPLLNHPVEVPGGELTVDLAWPEFGLALEYQGRYHADPAQWARDLVRLECLRDTGLTIVQATAEQLFGDPAQLVSRVARHLRARGWTPAKPIDWTKCARFSP